MASDRNGGLSRGDGNAAALAAYIGALEAEGRSLPSRGGKVNVSAVALACGFDRAVLYTSARAMKVLDEAVARLGLELPGHERAPAASADGPDSRDRRILQLDQANASLKAENGSMRAERNALREKLRRFEHIEAHMVETGRRVVL